MLGGARQRGCRPSAAVCATRRGAWRSSEGRRGSVERRPDGRLVSLGRHKPVRSGRPVRRAVRGEPVRARRSHRFVARRRRGRAALPARLIGLVARPRRATHMTVPDKDIPPSRRDSADLGSVVELVKDYARQETRGPIQGAGKWLAMGAAGAVMLGTGCVFLILGILRLVQNEFGRSFRSTWV